MHSISFWIFAIVVSITTYESVRAQNYDPILKETWKNVELPDSTRFKAIRNHYDRYPSDLESNLKLSNYHYRLAVEKGNKEEKMDAISEKSRIYYKSGNFVEAKKALAIQDELVRECRDTIEYLNSLLLKSGMALDENDYLLAIKYINEGRKFSKRHNIPGGEINFLVNGASFYDFIGDSDRAVSYLQEAEKIAKTLKTDAYNGLIWHNLASVYLKKEEYQRTLDICKKAMRYFQHKKDNYGMSFCYHTMALAENALGQDNLALKHIVKAIDMIAAMEDTSRLLESLVLKGQILLKSNVDLAIETALEGQKLVNENTPVDLKSELFLLFSNSYKEVGNFELSLTFFELSKKNEDSLKDIENRFAAIRETIHDEVEDELLQLEASKREEKKRLKENASNKYFLVVSISMVIIGLLLLLFRLRIVQLNKKRNELLLNLENLKHQDNSRLAFEIDPSMLNREKIEQSIERKLNSTDWNVLQIILEDPFISNKDIASKVFKSPDGVVSSLRRMYDYFEIGEIKYKKIALVMDAVNRSK